MARNGRRNGNNSAGGFFGFITALVIFLVALAVGLILVMGEFAFPNIAAGLSVFFGWLIVLVAVIFLIMYFIQAAR